MDHEDRHGHAVRRPGSARPLLLLPLLVPLRHVRGAPRARLFSARPDRRGLIADFQRGPPGPRTWGVRLLESSLTLQMIIPARYARGTQPI